MLLCIVKTGQIAPSEGNTYSLMDVMHCLQGVGELLKGGGHTGCFTLNSLQQILAPHVPWLVQAAPSDGLSAMRTAAAPCRLHPGG